MDASIKGSLVECMAQSAEEPGATHPAGEGCNAHEE